MTSALSETQADIAERHLHDLGVRDDILSADERAALDRDGYLILHGMIDPLWLERLRTAFDRHVEFIFRRATPEARGSCTVFDLANIDSACDPLWSHPRVLAAARHILGRPFKLSSLNGRDPGPGQGAQDLHADWGARSEGQPFHVANSLWLLDDFTADNGATRLLPGSHLRDQAELAGIDRKAVHPQQVVPQAPAGTVVVFNAHTWHGGTMNRSGARRRVMHGYFTAREHPQQLDQRVHLRVATQRRLSPAQRWLMDVD